MAAKAQGDGYNASCGLRRRQTQGSTDRAGIDAAGVSRQSRHRCEHREQDRAQRDRASYVHRSQASGGTRCGTSAAYQEGGLTLSSTNGHGPKRAILYARVSTDEQARSGYSLAQQLEALREYAAREGYEVLEEVSDPGQSGASLERPGMDSVRDLVAAGGVSVVLAQDRDRFAREPAIINYSDVSLRSTARRYVPSTTEEMRVQRVSLLTASLTSSPSTSGRRPRSGRGVASCARLERERL